MRDLHKGDINKGYLQLLSQLTSINPESISRMMFEEFVNNLNDSHKIFVIEYDDKIIAAGTIYIENKLIHDMGRVGHIEDVVVDESYRRMGFGKEIIDSLTSYGHVNGCYKVILSCSAENKAFYESCGYQQKEITMVNYL